MSDADYFLVVSFGLIVGAVLTALFFSLSGNLIPDSDFVFLSDAKDFGVNYPEQVQDLEPVFDNGHWECACYI